MKEPQKISYTLVRDNINKFIKNENDGEETLRMLFNDYQDNGDFRHVMVKATVLDNIYSTGIRYVDFPFVIKNIVDKHERIDELLKSSEREYELYYLIAFNNYTFKNSKGEDENVHNAYSFATKYLSFTKPNLYPIMDSYSKELLNKFCKSYSELPELSTDTIKYEIFCKTFDAFRDLVNKIVKDETKHEYTPKEIDMFLWQYAKDLKKD